MMTTSAGHLAAFDRHAPGYDGVAESALGVELRQRVHEVLAAYVDPDTTAVDLGCGTGIDAAWLGGTCRQVAAFDPAPAMVKSAAERCQRFENVIVTRAAIGEVLLDAPVDLALANFGAVNCADPAELRAQLCQVVRPGGHAVIVTMARWCPIEIGIGLATVNRALLRRRRSPNPDPAYPGLVTRYLSAGDLAAALTPGFELVSAESLGLVLPPLEQRHWLEGRPRVRRVLARLDRRLGRVGAAAGIGDHHIAVFVRNSR